MRINFIHNSMFRLFAPPVFGVWAYLLILLIFDRIEELSDNFFLIEVILCMLISFFVFECTKYSINLCNRVCNESTRHIKRILLQSVFSILLSIFITSLTIIAYYKLLVGFNTFSQELVVFNLIFLLGNVLLQSAYFSIYFLNQSNDAKIAQGEKTKLNTENELRSYKNKINLVFLTQSLETLIGLAHKEVQAADDFVGKLSAIYRSILSETKTELVELGEEINVAKNLIEILNHQLNDCLYFNSNFKVNNQLMVVPGTMIVLVEKIINETIINKYQPLSIECFIDKKLFCIKYKKNNKLKYDVSKNSELENIQKVYSYFSEEQIKFTLVDGFSQINVPLFEMKND